MNVLETYTIESPYGSSEECAKITIFDTAEWFILSDTTTVGVVYTFSAWIKSDAEGSFTVGESYIKTSSEWARHKATFTADDVDLKLIFSVPGTYYIYHSKLEIGNMATDWSPAPEDTEARFDATDDAIESNAESIVDTKDEIVEVKSSLQILADSVVTIVPDEEGNTTELKQTGTGWTFNLTDLDNTISDALDNIDTLLQNKADVSEAISGIKSTLEDHSKLQDYVTIGSINEQPCIELGEHGGDFKLIITNTEMYFMNGTVVLTTITNQKMIVENIEVSQELQFGNESQNGGFWIWQKRTNGNLGLSWKEVDN